MTAPALPAVTSALGLPAWYEGGFVDIERLLNEYFSTLMTGVICVTWLPPEKEMLERLQKPEKAAYLRIFRSGGEALIGTGGKPSVDQPQVQFAAYSANRDISWEVIEFVRQTLYCYRGGGGRVEAGDLYAHVTMLREMTGPSLSPEAFRDPRLVPVTFELETQRRKGLPSFRAYSTELGL